MNRGNLRLVIRMTGKAGEVFALLRLLAKRHGAKTLGEIRESCHAKH